MSEALTSAADCELAVLVREARGLSSEQAHDEVLDALYLSQREVPIEIRAFSALVVEVEARRALVARMRHQRQVVGRQRAGVLASAAARAAALTARARRAHDHAARKRLGLPSAEVEAQRRLALAASAAPKREAEQEHVERRQQRSELAELPERIVAAVVAALPQPVAPTITVEPTIVPAPEVHVTVEAPRAGARTIRVSEDEDGNRSYHLEED